MNLRTDKPAKLVFDGTHHLHRTFFSAKEIGSKMKNGAKMDFIKNPDKDHDVLRKKLLEDFVAIVSNFRNIYSGVIYCVDSKSWRKSYESSVDYKGDREKDEDVDWDGVYNAHGGFLEDLSRIGVVISKVDECEGDDLAYEWSRMFTENDQNVVIVSSDRDLNQLVVKNDDTRCFTLQYDRRGNRLFIPPGFDMSLWEDHSTHASIFDMKPESLGDIVNAYSELMSNTGEVQTVKANELVFSKVLSGDRKDSVPPVLKRKGKSVGPKTAEKIMRKVQNHFPKDTLDPFSEDMVDKACEEVLKCWKSVDATHGEVKERFEENRDLLVLSNEAIPRPVWEKMQTEIEDSPKGDRTSTLSDRKKLFEAVGIDPEDDKYNEEGSSGFGGVFSVEN